MQALVLKSSEIESSLDGHHRFELFCYIAPWIDDLDDARELTYETLAEARPRLSLQDPAPSLPPWVRRIARRKMLDYLSAHTPDMHGFHLYLLGTEDGEMAADQLRAVLAVPSVDRSTAHAFLRQVFALLTRDQRAALWLRHVEGLSYQEIGAILGRKTKAVDTLMFQTLRKVRQSGLMPVDADTI